MIIQADSVNKNYGDFFALKDIELTINTPAIYCITGPSGSGKTTLLKVLSGLLPPSNGKVFYQDDSIYDLESAKLAQVRNRVNGFVFQDYFLEDKFTVFENVTVPLYIRKGIKKLEIKEMTMEALRIVGMENKFNQIAGSLSGGEKQRTAIARAIVGNPSVIYADEPTGNLDQKNSDLIVELFEKMVENKKIVVLVTHNNEIVKRANFVVSLIDGKIVERNY